MFVRPAGLNTPILNMYELTFDVSALVDHSDSVEIVIVSVGYYDLEF
jgi:hypothetical protein